MTAEDLWVALTSTDEAHKEIPGKAYSIRCTIVSIYCLPLVGIHLAVVNSAHEDAERTDSDFREVGYRSFWCIESN